jgi:hypothetical protein
MPARLRASHSGKWHFAKGSLHPAALRRQRHGLGARRHHGHDGDAMIVRGLIQRDAGLLRLTKEGRAVLAALLAKGG